MLTDDEIKRHAKKMGVMCEHCDRIVGFVDTYDPRALCAAQRKKDVEAFKKALDTIMSDAEWSVETMTELSLALHRWIRQEGG